MIDLNLPHLKGGCMIEKYRPSNGTEGLYFMAQWCDKCTKDNYPGEPLCPIIADTFSLKVSDPRYPDEWRYDEGKPVCTAFERKRRMYVER
jgi:hypothetical protein